MKLFKEIMKEFIREEDGIGVVEIILILVILIGLVLIFKNQIEELVNNILESITSNSEKIYNP
jgi:Flp pilus assembly pilin Flp